MSFGVATYALGLTAGALSTLSPCVLPLVPVLLASALNAHRFGPWALGLGVALSFAVSGVLLAGIGASLGLVSDTFQVAGAVVLALFGLVLLVPRLQALFSQATASVSNSGSQVLARINGRGLGAQFTVGLLLGVIWSPCVGPTLGAATTLASHGQNLVQTGFLMLLFGIGAAAPMILLGSLSHATLSKVRGRLLMAGQMGKKAFGVVLLGMGVLIATGADKAVQAWLLDRTPSWIVALTTRY